MTVYVAEAHAHVQRLVSVDKMATVFEEYIIEEERCFVRLGGGGAEEGVKAKDIHKEMFPIYGGKCLLHRAVHRCVANVSLMTKKLKRGAKVAENCGFRGTGKAMGQVYQSWWRICREINIFFQAQISRVLRLISIYDLFTDPPSYIEFIMKSIKGYQITALNF
jgi:hypothetical protein